MLVPAQRINGPRESTRATGIITAVILTTRRFLLCTSYPLLFTRRLHSLSAGRFKLENIISLVSDLRPKCRSSKKVSGKATCCIHPTLIDD